MRSVAQIRPSALLKLLRPGLSLLVAAFATIGAAPGRTSTSEDTIGPECGEGLGEPVSADPPTDSPDKANETLRALIAVIPAGVTVVDAQGRIILANPAANAIFGGPVTGTAFGPQGRYTLHHADGTPFPSQDLPLPRAILHGETTKDVEIMIRRQDGTECIILSAANPIRDDQGRLTGAVAIFQDVTRRVRTEEQLRKSEESLAEAQRIAQLGSWDWNIPTNQLWWSDEIYRIFGVSPQEFGATYEAFLSYVYSDDRAMVEAKVRAALREGEPYDIDHRIVRRDGSVRVVRERADVTFDQNRHPLRMVGTVQDVTAQRQAEHERRRFLEREQALAEIAQALVREREFSRVVEVVLDQCLTVLGMDVVALWLAESTSRVLELCSARHLSHELLAKIQRIPFDEPLLPAHAARTEHMQVVPDIASSELSPATRQLFLREGLSSLLAVPLLVHGHLVGVLCPGTRATRQFSEWDIDLNEAVAGLFGVAIENARLDEEVRDTLRLHEEFVSAAAHELRTPLTVIKGRAQRALRSDAHEEPARQAFEAIDQEVERISRLADDLLAIVQIRPGHVNLHRVSFDLSDATRMAVARVAAKSADKEFQIATSDPLIVDADPILIAVVLTRLLENAVRYSPVHGRIGVNARRVDDEAVVSVTDHGVGINAERQRHVFDPFYEPIPAGSPGYVGIVSLGLHLSKQIIDAHHGRIWVTSTPGKGSTFSFSLPVEI